MSTINKRKNISTIWLDFLHFVFTPFYILTMSLNAVKIFNNNIIGAVLYLICALYGIIIFYQLLKRKKITYYLMFVFCLISIITVLIEIIKKYNIKEFIYIVILIVGAISLWLIPNYIYLFKRKSLFKEYPLLNIKKCPGCKRMIPKSMNCCGRCGFKG